MSPLPSLSLLVLLSACCRGMEQRCPSLDICLRQCFQETDSYGEDSEGPLPRIEGVRMEAASEERGGDRWSNYDRPMAISGVLYYYIVLQIISIIISTISPTNAY